MEFGIVVLGWTTWVILLKNIAGHSVGLSQRVLSFVMELHTNHSAETDSKPLSLIKSLLSPRGGLRFPDPHHPLDIFHFLNLASATLSITSSSSMSYHRVEKVQSPLPVVKIPVPRTDPRFRCSDLQPCTSHYPHCCFLLIKSTQSTACRLGVDSQEWSSIPRHCR